jgi:hypothetical protein
VTRASASMKEDARRVYSGGIEVVVCWEMSPALPVSGCLETGETGRLEWTPAARSKMGWIKWRLAVTPLDDISTQIYFISVYTSTELSNTSQLLIPINLHAHRLSMQVSLSTSHGKTPVKLAYYELGRARAKQLPTRMLMRSAITRCEGIAERYT